MGKLSFAVKNVGQRAVSIFHKSGSEQHEVRHKLYAPSMRQSGGVRYYLTEEIKSAREAVKQLDAAVSKAQSCRERASKLLEEAHRALSRLEQVSITVDASQSIG